MSEPMKFRFDLSRIENEFISETDLSLLLTDLTRKSEIWRSTVVGTVVVAFDR